jgi:hypothetical protein
VGKQIPPVSPGPLNLTPLCRKLYSFGESLESPVIEKKPKLLKSYSFNKGLDSCEKIVAKIWAEQNPEQREGEAFSMTDSQTITQFRLDDKDNKEKK